MGRFVKSIWPAAVAVGTVLIAVLAKPIPEWLADFDRNTLANQEWLCTNYQVGCEMRPHLISTAANSPILAVVAVVTFFLAIYLIAFGCERIFGYCKGRKWGGRVVH